MPEDRTLRVLIVEDDILIGMDLEMTVQDLGHVVVDLATTVKQALAIVEDAPIDIAMLDVNLGRGTTSEPIAAALAERAIPYVFLTAYERSAVSFAAEDDLVLPKPPRPAEIESSLEALARTRCEHVNR